MIRDFVRRDADDPWRAHHFFYHGDLDAVLNHFVAPAIAELFARRLIDTFFFTRYPLGGPHIRLRYRLLSDGTSAAAQVLRSAATRFLERWRCESNLDVDRIRQESRAVLAAAPEDSELYYENHTLLAFPFAPEVERYGGPELLGHSLDFFAVSSAQALAAIGDPSWAVAGRRGTVAMRLLLRQAWGFAASEEEFLSHLGYHLPVAEELGSLIWSKADAAFAARPEVFRALFRHELSVLAALDGAADPPPWPSASLLPWAAWQLSAAVRRASPASRWQIGHSQLHMTANRLGFMPVQEMHLQRILWRAAGELRAAEPVLWRQLMPGPRERGAGPGSTLRGLLEPAITHLQASATLN